MKIIFIILPFIFLFNVGYTQKPEASCRLFGEISTVDNKTYKGFISWGGIKNYWIDFFEASKTKNPYTSYFSKSDGVIFQKDGREFVTPPIHIFCCRFGNIKSIRPTNETEILLQLKNGNELTLVKGHSPDINTTVQITTSTEKISLKWDHISEIHFRTADSSVILPDSHQVAGVVKSSQGIYKGLIYWNYNQKQNPEKNKDINIFLGKMRTVTRCKRMLDNYPFELLPQEELPKAFVPNSSVLSPMANIMINMPNIGGVIIPPTHFEELNIIPLSELNLLSYDDFTPSQPIQGEVTTRSNGQVSGELAYDLDESLDIEILNGKNNNIDYWIPFKFIKTIEPKNYKYSFITLKNGSQLSLGDATDVNRENSGIIVFGNYEHPFYVPWNEVKAIKFK